MTALAASENRQSVNDLLTLAEVALQLRRPEATLRYWRYLGIGPRSFKMRGRVFYRQASVDEWLAMEEENAVGQVVL